LNSSTTVQENETHSNQLVKIIVDQADIFTLVPPAIVTGVIQSQ